jgi:hypothetical protein
VHTAKIDYTPTTQHNIYSHRAHKQNRVEDLDKLKVLLGQHTHGKRIPHQFLRKNSGGKTELIIAPHYKACHAETPVQ